MTISARAGDNSGGRAATQARSGADGYMCNMHPDDLIRGVQLRSPRPNERDIENLIDLVAEDIVGGDCPLNEIGPRRRPG